MVTRGQVLTLTRTFTVDDVRAFTVLSRDAGRHHVTPDAQGRLMVHGLLTASLPTALGGTIHFIARSMRFEFLRPVWTDEAIVCSMTIVEAEPDGERVRVTMNVVCTNPSGAPVLRGEGAGFIQSAT